MSDIIMASDTIRYSHKDAQADREAAARREHDARIAEWLREYPQVGALNSGKFYVYPVGGEYREVAAFEKVK